MKPTCPLCGKPAETYQILGYQFEYGIGEDATMLATDLTVRKCDPCGEEWTDHVGEAQRAKAINRYLEVAGNENIVPGRSL